MALVATVQGPFSDAGTPYTKTHVDITLTGDNSAVGGSLAGFAHGGPSGLEPDEVWFTQIADSAGGDDHATVMISNFDTTNDEVDIKYTVINLNDGSTPLGSAATVKVRAHCVWYNSASGGIS